MNQLVVPEGAIKYILFQRTAYLRILNSSFYGWLNSHLPFIYKQIVSLEAKVDSSRIKALYEDDMRKEYLSIRESLPKTCHKILDIGCGMAGIDVFLNNHYIDAHQPEFYLLDKTEIAKNIFYHFKPQGAFYNSLEISRKMLTDNGIPEENIYLLEADATNAINIDFNIDLIISLISWGYHYPVETYLDRVYKLLSQDGRLIIDVRKGTDGVDKLKNKFSELNIILDSRKFQRVWAIK
jgi:SAM-dependent methyltransferase